MASLPAPLALIALALPGASRILGPATDVDGGPQRQWAAVWLLGASLLAGYPWVRESPLESFFALMGLSPTPLAAVAVVGLGLLIALATRFSPWGQRVPWPAMAAILALLLLSPPAGRAPLHQEATLLTARQPRLVVDLPAPLGQRPATKLVVDSNLAYAEELEPGRPVATLRLHHEDGKVTEWPLRAGEHTAEWAAGREDVARRPGFVAPPPWQSTMAPEGGYFAQRFRSHWQVDSPSPVIRAVVLRRPRLPKEVVLTVYRMELRP